MKEGTKITPLNKYANINYYLFSHNGFKLDLMVSKDKKPAFNLVENDVRRQLKKDLPLSKSLNRFYIYSTFSTSVGTSFPRRCALRKALSASLSP